MSHAAGGDRTGPPVVGSHLDNGGGVIPAPSRADPTVAQALRVLGGAWGRYAVTGRWWSPMRVLLALGSVTLVLAFVQKAPCADGNWTANKQYTHACYSDVIPLWNVEGLDIGAVPFRDHAVEYPVLTGGFMWLTSGITHAAHGLFSSASEVQTFGLITSLLLAVCALLMIAGTVGAAGPRPYDAALAALSPLLVFHAFSNWDLLAMAFASCALWAWARDRPVAAGVLIGLGTAAKLYPLLLLVPIVVLAWRTGRYRPAVWACAAAATSWAAVNLPIAFAYPRGWREFFAFNIDRGTEWDTIWYVGHYALTRGQTDWRPPGLMVAALTGAAEVGIAVLALRAPRRPRVAQLALLAVAAFLLTSKIWSRQYSLWLVPLVALARPKWRVALIWQFSEIALWIVFLLFLLGLGDPAHSIPYGWLLVFVLARDAMVLALCALVVREMWRPELDIVRSDGLDDPGGGPYDGAPDRTVGQPVDTSEDFRNSMSAP